MLISVIVILKCVTIIIRFARVRKTEQFCAKKTEMEKKTFVLHDSTVNTHGFRMLTEGVDLSTFRENPVMLLNHNQWDLPIGRWENIRVEGDSILADAVFDDGDERSRQIAGKVDRGFLKAASIGARPVMFSDDPSTWLPGQREPTVTKWIAREASICSIGANYHSLALYDAENRVIDLSSPGVLISLSGSRTVLPVEPDTKNVSTMLNQNNLKMNLRRFFGLNDAASEDAVIEAAESVKRENVTLTQEKTALEAENKRLKEKIEAADRAKADVQNAEAAALVEKAIKDARISAEGRAVWLADFAVDFENAKVRLSSIPARQPVAAQVETGAENEFIKLTWDEIDRKGRLEQLKTSDPSLFSLKYKERFGVEPKG